jgi:hypothetical protein
VRMPSTVNASWIASLDDSQLLEAEQKLHEQFNVLETREKRRAGDRYVMLRGPEPLVTAWLRWLMVKNATMDRGVVIKRPKS